MPRHADYVGPFPKDMPDHAVLDVSAAELALEVPCCSNASRRLGRHLVAALDEVYRLREATAAGTLLNSQGVDPELRLVSPVKVTVSPVEPDATASPAAGANQHDTALDEVHRLREATDVSSIDHQKTACLAERLEAFVQFLTDHTVTLGMSVREPTKGQ